MAYIGHRCNCGHSDLQHSQTGEGKTLGSCSASFNPCNCGPIPEPEVIPTFNTKGKQVERVIAPGGGLPSASGNPVVKTCPCDACTALYEQLASA
ncbi:hypothetical protein [Streptomyces sp. AK02-04a]|uniref:hypothetical protein n=1 Tax=Streptomyces sp. AK02-04a TaxID=3028649 RepID=UPI0029A96A68|nr:hypothetical protein [Streptomyces sp. AK02-04a]MDX3759299.1 hypothetical protein [Streptomyces sp. AK02-04a]